MRLNLNGYNVLIYNDIANDERQKRLKYCLIRFSRLCFSIPYYVGIFSPQPVRKRYALAVVPVLPQDVTGVEAVPIRTDRAQTSAYQPVSPVGTVEAVQVLHNRRRMGTHSKNGIVGTCKGVFHYLNGANIRIVCVYFVPT